VVTTQAPGRPSVVTRVRVENGERKQIELSVAPPPLPRDAPSPALATPAPSAAEVASAEEADAETARASRRTLAYGVGGLGAAGLLVGSITGALVLGEKGTIEDNCVDTRCNATGKKAADRAQSLGLASTIGFGVGIAGLATAAVLLLTEPTGRSGSSARSFTPLVAQRPGGVVIGLERAW
jgi:hypothetical protein